MAFLFLASPQGVPLDTSKRPADQRLPPYPYSPPSVVLPTQPPAPKPLQQPGLPSQACSVQSPGGQLHCGTLYPPSSTGHGQQSYHRPMSDFSLGNVSTQISNTGAGEGLAVGLKGPEWSCWRTLDWAIWVGRDPSPPQVTQHCQLGLLSSCIQPHSRLLSQLPQGSFLFDDGCSHPFSSWHVHALSREVRCLHQLWVPCLLLSFCLLPSP